MSDATWRMPRGWPFDAVQLTARGIVLDYGRHEQELVPWRLFRRIQRPGGGKAYLRLVSGALVLPDRNSDDERWLERLAQHAVAADGGPATRDDYSDMAWLFLLRHASRHRVMRRARVELSGRAAAVRLLGWSFLLAVVTAAISDGKSGPWLGQAFACVALGLLVAAVARAMRSDLIRPAESTVDGGLVRAYEVQTDGVDFALASGGHQFARFERLERLRYQDGHAVVVVHGQAPLAVTDCIEPLQELFDAINSVRSGRFEGMDGQPPTAASISRVTGDAEPAVDRGISLAQGGGDD